MTFDNVLVVGAGASVSAFVALVVFQTPGPALLIGLVVSCGVASILRLGRVAFSDRRSQTPPVL